MDELIPINKATIGSEQVTAVNARDLHEFLGVGKKFASWFEERVEGFGFVEGVDYAVFPDFGKKSGGRPRKEYAITISMAKELCMVERNEKGKQARLYFIECERVAKQKTCMPALPDFTNPAIAARAWAEQYEAKLTAEKKVAVLENQIEEDKPKVAFAEHITSEGNSLTIQAAAKVLGYPQKKLFDFMRQKKWIFARGSAPYADHVQNGDMSFRYIDIQRSDGSLDPKPYAHILPKGLKRLYHMLREENLIERNPQIEMNFKGV